MPKTRHNTAMMTDEPEPIPETESEAPDRHESESVEAEAMLAESPVDESDEPAVETVGRVVQDPEDGSITPEALAISRQMADLIALEADELDVDQALAAVASLGELVAEPDERELAAEDEFEIPEGLESVPEPEPVEQVTSFFARPPLMTLQRGQMASVIPALLLMVIGAWLVFALTTAENPPDASLVITVITGGFGLVLIVQWLESNRWTQGVFFAGLTLILCAGIFLWLMQSDDPGLGRGWPLFVTAGGAAFALSAFFSPASENRQGFIGLVIAVGGLVGYAVTADLLDGTLVNTIGNLWPVVVVVLLVLWGLPVIFRGRR